MDNFFYEAKKTLCCGCRACEQICPAKAIEMIEDEEGFLYPHVDKDKCINCGMCVKVCPIKNGGYINETSIDTPEVYAAYHKEREVLVNSTSGGAFSSIAQLFCDNDYVIYGVLFDENLVVKHAAIADIAEINKFRGSKYVQSDIGSSYREIKLQLQKEKKVLFSGTPCQVAGLKAFLQKDYENLMCVDIICHGVPSPKVFRLYKEWLKEKYKSEIQTINFRDKSKKDWNTSYMSVSFQNGKKYSVPIDDDFFNIGFLSGCFNRPICHSCPFTRIPRVSDITVADFWGIDEIHPGFANDEGTSLMVINTEKGKRVFTKRDEYLMSKKSEVENAIKFNPQLCRPAKMNLIRERFMFDLCKQMEFEDLRKKYLKRRPYLKRFVSKTFSIQTKKKIKKLLRINKL